MPISVANTAGGNYTNSTSTHSVDWSSSFTPTAGNCLLLVLHVGASATGPSSPPSGWVQVGNDPRSTYTVPFGAAVYLKPNCSSSDTSATIDAWVTGGLSGRWSCTEFEGAKLSGALGPTSDNGLSSADTTVSSGTTATLAQAAGLALAIMAMDNGNNMTGSYSPGSWTQVTTQNRTTNGGHEVYRQALTSTDGISVTYSGYTSDESYICVAALYEAAPSGPPTLTGISASGITSSGATLTITAS